MSRLGVHNLTVQYGQLTALRGIDLVVEEGETVFITGPNGAGKSSLLSAIAGAVPCATGRIEFDGRLLSGRVPEEIARLGLSMVPEGRHVFGALSIEENLRIGAGMRRDREAVENDLDSLYGEFPMLADRRHSHAGVLSGGQQQMLVIARALMTNPKLIMIDEPSLGLAPKIIDQVYDILLRLKAERGLTLLIVEQSSTRAVMAGGRMVLLRNGSVVMQGDAAELDRSGALHEAYFGFEEGAA